MPSKLPASRVPILDAQTNTVNNDWYRWFVNVYELLGGGKNDTSLTDLQLGPAGGVGTPGPAGATGPAGPPGPFPAGIFNVLDYGAVGDGTTDDTVAIQAALDAATATGYSVAGKATVYFPPGAYLVSSTLTVNAVPGLIIRGEGACSTSSGKRGSTILGGSVNPVLYFPGSGTVGSWEVVDLGFVAGVIAVKVKDTYNGHIHECGFYNASSGQSVYLQNCTNTRVTDNQFWDVQTAIYDTGGTGVMIANNAFDAINVRAVSLNSTANAVVSDNVVNSAAAGILLSETTFCAVTGNVINQSSTSTAINITQSGSTKTNATVSSNTVSVVGANSSDKGIDISGAENCAVIGNVINAYTAINLATNGAHTCANTYYDGNICVGYSVGTYGLITVGGGVTAIAGVNPPVTTAPTATKSNFMAYKSSNYSSTSNLFAMVYDTEEVDALGEYNTGTGEFTPTTSGMYFVGTGIRCDTTIASSDFFTATLMWNNSGTPVAVKQIGVFVAFGSIQYARFENTVPVYLTAGRPYYIEIDTSSHPWTFYGSLDTLWFAAAQAF